MQGGPMRRGGNARKAMPGAGRATTQPHAPTGIKNRCKRLPGLDSSR